MAGAAGKMQVVLASEAARQKTRQQEYETEQEKLFTTLVFPDKLKALAEETDSKKKKPSSPKSPLAFVNHAFSSSSASPFSSFPTAVRRATVDAVAKRKSKIRRSPHRRNVSLDALDSVGLLQSEQSCAEIEACQTATPPPAKEHATRVYVSRPLVARRFSSDEQRPCVTIFSSEAPPAAKPAPLTTPPPRPTAPLAPRMPGNPAVRLREGKARDVVDGPHRVLSFPNLDYDADFEDDLKYWRDVLRNSPRLKALEKR